MLFTTSWDDGYALDRRVADLLTRYGCTGTFYVCPKAQHGRAMLSAPDIRALAATHEVGAHTLKHPRLTRIPRADARTEIAGSKAWVESVTGKECALFCYPYGDLDADVRELAGEAGFRGARTTEPVRFRIEDPLRMPMTLHLSPFPWRKTFKPAWKVLDPIGPLRAIYPLLRLYRVPLRSLSSWRSMAIALFDGARKRDEPFFHLFGHSHELEKYGLWEDLEAFLMHVQASGVRGVVNSALLP